MNPQEITSADVAAWLKLQAAKVHERHEYAGITVNHSCFKGCERDPNFSIYCGVGCGSTEHTTIEACFEEIGGITPQIRAKKLRDDAAELIAKADAIESNF